MGRYMRKDSQANRKPMLGREFAAFGAIAFGLAVLAEIWGSLYRVPLSCETGCDRSTAKDVILLTYMAIGWATIWLGYVAVRRSLRWAAGSGGGSRALAAGAANLVLYSLWFVVPVVWDGMY